MKLTLVDNYGTIDQVVSTHEVEMVEFEDQTNLKNGMWLHIWTKDGEWSWEFNPHNDLFRIEK